MAEHQARTFTADEFALVAAGLDALGRLDAARLAVEIRKAAAVVIVKADR